MALRSKFPLCLLPCLMCILLCDPSLWAQHTTFNKSYGGPGDDVGLGMVATPDGGHLVVGSTTSYGPNPGEHTANGHVIRLDSEGQVIWRRSYGGPMNDFFRDVTVLPDGGYLAVGNYDFGGNSSTAQIWLSRIAEDGTVIWNKRLGASSQWEEAHLIRPIGNGDCIIAGTTSTNPGTTSDILLIKVDMDGQRIWASEYRTSVRESPTGMILLEDGSILIAGIRYVIPRSEGFILKMSANGTLLWDRSYSLPSQSLGFTGFSRTGNNTYIAASSKGLIGLDGDGNIVWGRSYAPMNGEDLSFNDVTHLGPDRSLVLATRRDQPFTTSSMAALVVDSTGNLMAAQQYAQDPAIGNGLVALANDNGGSTLLGRIVEEDFNIHIVRTWAEGEGIEAGCFSQKLQLETTDLPAITFTSPYQQFPSPQFTNTSMELAPDTAGTEFTYCSNVGIPTIRQPAELTLYPVPAFDRLHLGEALAAGPLLVEVVDAAGRTVMLHEDLLERSIDIHALTEGPYLCRITLQDGTQAVARFLVVR